MKAKFCLIALWAAIPAFAQQHVHHHPAADAASPAVPPQPGHAPYAGMQTRTIAAVEAGKQGG